MVIISSSEDFSQASGNINYANLNFIYEGIIDNSFVGMGRTITLHLPPQITQNDSVASNPIKAGAYNPFLGGSVRPTEQGQNRGVKITYRDVEYTAMIKHGPKPADDRTGMGALMKDQVRTTIVYESLDDLLNCLVATIDGLRYSRLGDYKPIGLTDKKYIIQDWQRVQEEEINA